MKTKASALIIAVQEQRTAILQSTLKDFELHKLVRCCTVMLSTGQYVDYRGGSNQIRCLYLRESNTQDGDPPTVS